MSNELATVSPRTVSELSFNDKLASFSELTELRESLKRELKEHQSKMNRWAHDHQFKPGELFTVYIKHTATKDKEIERITRNPREVDWIRGVIDYPTGLNATLLKRFPGLGEFAQEVADEYDALTGRGKVDEKATEKIRAEWADMVDEKDEIETKLQEVVGKIEGVKEFVDLADKVSRVGAKRK